MKCPNCKEQNVSATQFEKLRGLMFQWCKRCEATWWIRDGHSVSLAAVLEDAKDHQAYRHVTENQAHKQAV